MNFLKKITLIKTLSIIGIVYTIGLFIFLFIYGDGYLSLTNLLRIMGS